MQQGAEGLWTATSPVLAPEIYSYHFVIDGTSFLDPRNTHVVNNLLGDSWSGGTGTFRKLRAVPDRCVRFVRRFKAPKTGPESATEH
jgi:hypothetical protein